MTAFDSLLRELAREVAREVVAELRAGDTQGMVDQTASPLGRKRHAAAVRRRVAAGESGAAIVGRRFLLSREALDHELAAQSKRPRKAKPAAPVQTDELADARSKYDLRRAG